MYSKLCEHFMISFQNVKFTVFSNSQIKSIRDYLLA